MTTPRLDGRDPTTGQVLRIDLDGARIGGITRLGANSDPDLPYLAPGLIDLQDNGYAGVPTVVTASEDRIQAALEGIAEVKRRDPLVNAAVPYAHMDGTFLSDQDGPRGVHAREWIRPIDAAEVARWATSGVLGYVTVSPHWEDSPRQIAAIRAQGVRVAVGHTHATPEQFRAAVDAGATLSTHLGNGVALQLPRHPNQLWTQLAEDRLTCGFIARRPLPADDSLTVMLHAEGPDQAFLISDAVALAGSPPGGYHRPVGGDVELSTDGRLSYAGTQMLAGLAVSNADCLRHVIARYGYAVAAPADLVLLIDRGEVLEVVHQGGPVAARSRS